MNKKELVSAIAGKTDLNLTEAGKALDAFAAAVADALKAGESVQLTGFLSIKVVSKAAREGINPSTREKIQIPAKKVIKFKAGSVLEDAIK
jgi:DNA-binding protein HU-beta